MARKLKLLNVKSHLRHVQMILEGLEKYGYVPAVEHECHIAGTINQAILKKHEAKGTRKDIYVHT